MNILSYNIDSNSINLSTDTNVDRLILNYGKLLNIEYTDSNINSTDITITKENLNLKTLDNIYFKIELIDYLDKIDKVGLYTINIINEKDSTLYNTNNLKQELDNLNYYDGIIESLTNKEKFLEANDMFNNFINFLKNKLNGNNFFHSVSKQNKSDSCN